MPHLTFRKYVESKHNSCYKRHVKTHVEITKAGVMIQYVWCYKNTLSLW